MNMEPIKETLKRAREDRQVAALRETRSFSGPLAVEVSGEQERAEGIVYSKTRKIKVADAVLTRNRIIVNDPGHEATTAYKVLRTQVLQRMAEHEWTTLAVTSPHSAEGTTLTAINLALSMAKEVNHTVLLVDLNLRSPSVHRYFDYTPEFGLRDYLLDNVSLDRILVNPEIARFVFLPGRDSITGASELLSSPRMVGLVDEMKSRYAKRIIIFDVPPVLEGDETIMFAPYIDAALLVVCEGKTRHKDLNKAMGLIGTVPILGTVLNRSPEGARKKK